MGTYKTYKEKLMDPQWQKRRLQIFERDKFTCQVCMDTRETLHVHHLQYFKGDPWDVEDIYLITLCEICHEEEERLKSVDILGKAFSQYGLTRLHLLKLLEHCKYVIEHTEKRDRNIYDPLGKAYNKLVDPCTDELQDYYKWLSRGGRIDV
jgi:hypothetical protein